MAQYLLKMIQPVGEVPDQATLASVMEKLGVIRQELAAQNSWVFGGGLHQPDSASMCGRGPADPSSLTDRSRREPSSAAA